MDFTREALKSFAGFAPTDTAVYHLSENGSLDTLYLSENIPSLLDLTREEYLKITACDAMDLTLPGDRPGLQAAMASCIRTGRPFDHYYRVFHKLKGFEWVHVHAHVCGLMDGRPLIMALFSNMTAEGGIYQEILDASDRSAVVIDRKSYEILYANDNARKNGPGEGNMLNQTCYSLLHGAGKPCAECIMERPESALFVEEVKYDSVSKKWEQFTKRSITWCGHDAVLMYIKDITAEKTAELDVERYRQMYADATLEAKLIVWVYDAQKHRVSMLWDGYTREVCEKLGVPQVIENVPDSLAQFVDQPDRDCFTGMYDEIDRGALRSECQFKFRLPGQETQQYERAVAKAMFDENGRKLGVYCFGQNITAQKQEEEKYQRAYAELEKAHLYSLGSYRLNLTKNRCEPEKGQPETVLRYFTSGTADEFFIKISGIIADEEVKDEFYRRFNRETLLDGFSKGTEKVSLEYPSEAKDGVRRWREGLLFMMRNPKTGDVEGVTYAMDIDGRKKSEFVLEKLIHENFDYIGIIHQAKKTFEFISRRPWISLGSIGEQLDYEECRAFVSSRFTDTEELDHFMKVTAIDHIAKSLYMSGNCAESYFSTADGKTRRSRLEYSWLGKPGGDILVMRSDITDVYEQEQSRLARMRDALAAADRANEEKSTFLSTMSHDLRTPLNGVISFTDFAMKEKDPAKKQEYLEKIKYSGALLLNLVNDTLELSRIESGKMTLAPEVIPTKDVGRAVIESLRPVAEEKGVSIETGTFSDNYIFADKLKYQKIWINLISNAIKYTPAGGTVRAMVEVIDPPVNGRNRRIIVEDNGIGMSEEFMAKMFEPFSQENRPEAENAGGTGLGLAIVKRIVDLLGGEISVRSKVGEGTRFEIDVPVRVVDAPDAPESRPVHAGSGLAGKRVLLCEDNLLNKEIAATLLQSRGVLVDCAENGEVGLRMFAGSEPGRYDAILMDIRMPVMDGCTAAAEIRRQKRRDAKAVPIIAMTADAFEESVQAAMAAGMNSYLTKPVVPEKLFEELMKVCI